MVDLHHTTTVFVTRFTRALAERGVPVDRIESYVRERGGETTIVVMVVTTNEADARAVFVSCLEGFEKRRS
jgi:hypothetical protein